MNKEEVTMLGFEIVSYSGEARSYYLEAIKCAKNNEYDKAYELLELAEKSVIKAHNSQFDLIVKESKGEQIPFSLTFVHGQDHLMTTLLLKDLVNTIIDLYKKRDGE